MKDKKYLAWFYSAESMNRTLSVHSFLIDRLCENFEKIYFINMRNFKLFTDATSNRKKEEELNNEVDRRFKVPTNIEIFIPTTKKDLKDFMFGKQLIAINQLGTSSSDLKILFLLKKYHMKQVQIKNIGYSNISEIPLLGSIWKNLLFKINKVYSHKLVVLLTNLRLISKIQIRFTDKTEITKNIDKNYIKKILHYLNLFYVKEFILINSSYFDILKYGKFEISEDRIVLLDYNLDHPESVALQGKINKKNVEKHYYCTYKSVDFFSKMYKKKVVVCIHPTDNLKLKKKYYPTFDVVKYETMENIYKGFLILFFDSSAIVNAILLKKRILCLISNFTGKNINNYSMNFIKKSGVSKINIEDKIYLDKDKFLSKLDSAKKNYSNYIKSYVIPDGDNIGYEKIIKTLKERFFKTA